MNPLRNYQNKDFSEKLNLVKDNYGISNGVKKNSFTLLEVMVAISILTLAVGGSFTLIQQALVSTSLAKSKLTAAYLAQEGMEIVRNIRDNNWLNSSPSWKTGLTAGEYEADYDDLSLSSYADRYLYIDLSLIHI